jgi:hypothetical protein
MKKYLLIIAILAVGTAIWLMKRGSDVPVATGLKAIEQKQTKPAKPLIQTLSPSNEARGTESDPFSTAAGEKVRMRGPGSSSESPAKHGEGRMAPPPRIVWQRDGSTAGASSLAVPAWHPGEDAIAAITTADGHTIQNLHPNQVNSFPRVNIQPNDTVQVSVAWPKGSPGEPVVVAVEDGGSLGAVGQSADKSAQSKAAERVLKLALDDKGQIKFAFTCSAESGIFRVTLRKGAETKTVELWAGALPTLAEAK